jgi:hypothetical protein
MTPLDKLVEQYGDIRTVLVAGAAAARPEHLVERLTDAGVTVIGPVDTAKLALALVAQTPADLAIVTADLAGRRDGQALAAALQDIWGVPTVVLPRA